MSTGKLVIRLSSTNPVASSKTVAVAEVAPVPRSGVRETAIKLPLGVNDKPANLRLKAGSYFVRLYLPSGEVKAERVEIKNGVFAQLKFELEKTPHGLLSSAGNRGLAQTQPSTSEGRKLHGPSNRRVMSLVRSGQKATPLRNGATNLNSMQRLNLTGQVISPLGRSTTELKSIPQLIVLSEGWRYATCVDPNRSLPDEHLQVNELVHWWTGNDCFDPTKLNLEQLDEITARFIAGPPESPELKIGERVRAFVNVKDPIGGLYCMVFPEGWTSRSHKHGKEPSPPSVLLTTVLDTALISEDSSERAARWNCSPEVEDAEAMSLLGFLHTSQIEAGQVVLEKAHRWLFEKTVNPVAAAAGAFMLLSHSDQANGQLSPGWREWVKNLYNRFPTVPDGAIAMAQMAMNYGETGLEDDVDVERLREYALEAVRRGLPFLGTGIRRLTDVLMALEGDDRAEGRSGEQVEKTRRALALVHQLGRITVPSEFFTVLRLNEVPA